MTNRNISFAERTGSSVDYNINKKELFEYSGQFHKSLKKRR